MNTPIKFNRWIALGGLVVLVGVVLVACGGGDAPQAQPQAVQEAERATALSDKGGDDRGDSDEHRATNTPRRIDQTVFAGASTTVSAKLVATKNAGGAEIWISPELRPYVTVAPSSFEEIREGHLVEFSIVIGALINAQPTTATGTIQLRERNADGRIKGQLLARPIPVSLNVAVQTAGTLRAGNTTVSFSAPPGWRVIQESVQALGASIYNPRSVEEIAAGGEMTPPDATITIGRLDSSLTPDAYVNSQADGWYTYFKNRVRRSISGHPALVVDDLDASIPKYPIATAFVFVGDQVIIITGDQTSSSDFETVLANVRIQ